MEFLYGLSRSSQFVLVSSSELRVLEEIVSA